MAVQVRTIQMRRGLAVDFDPNKMVPGEWAVSQDNEKIYMCFTAGRVIEIGTTASIIHYIEESEAWAVGTKSGVPVDNSQPQYHNNSKYYADSASDSATNAATSESNASTSETNAATSEANALQYWNDVYNAVNRVLPTVSIDFTTGMLMIDGTSLYFGIDQTTGNLTFAFSP